MSEWAAALHCRRLSILKSGQKACLGTTLHVLNSGSSFWAGLMAAQLTKQTRLDSPYSPFGFEGHK